MMQFMYMIVCALLELNLQQVSSFMKPAVKYLTLHIVDVELFDCGVYALAFATELACGFDPAVCVWDSEKMRNHLLLCLENGAMSQFPVLEKRKLRLGRRVR